MAHPRPSVTADNARDAALQAEFNEKKWVWVPDEREGYLAGWVTKEDEEFGDVVIAANSEVRRVNLDELSKMNPPKFDRVADMADLTFLNEASVVHNLRLRYGSDAIYTYSGLFLVAMNPYKQLPHMYSDKTIAQYRGRRRTENQPHIYAIAEQAWVNMGEERENQSILITGESGAGKTENTKKVIQYLAAIATDSTPPGSHSRAGSTTAVVPSQGLPRSSSFRNPSQGVTTATTAKSKLGLLERQILQANPILEAFGNAQTQRNNNSSRFGKFIRITFAGDGSIAGANIDWYLLEKSRVVARSELERSFHVFYQLLEGGGALKDALLLDGSVDDYELLNKSRRLIDGVDDREEWRLLEAALDVVGFTQAEQFDLFRTLAAILHIGNIEIVADRSGEQARISVPAQAEKACHLLGVSSADFARAVLSPRVLAGREWVTQARTAQQARDELGALCKTLYEKTFGSLVDRVNRALDRPAPKSTFIGVLDIAGFEIFQENGFEQLCINYTNERLQQYFNHHMFVLEQEEYAREGIEWSFVNFGLDLQPTIDLIEESGGRPGILSCLDEECIMPKATDATFTAKLHGLWTNTDHPGGSKYAPARFAQGFVVQHYAGRVEYRTDGWLAKNKDPLNDNLTRVLASSSERSVAAMFAEGDGIKRVGGVVVKKGAFRTVTQRHKEQLASLMGQLSATQPHFVRCIVPNTLRRPGRVDVPLVLDQLRCNGVLEGIRIARLGYPNRLPFVECRARYELLVPGVLPPGYMDGRKAAARMLSALELDPASYRIGTTKVFFKAGVLADLEEQRDGLLYDIFGRLQAVARKWVARRQMKKILGRAVAARRIQENARLYSALKDWPWWQLYTKVRPLLAATRNDEELRRKSVELELAKERAERDARERQALETLKMELEADKRRVEEALAAERVQSSDREALLERSTRRQAELEEDVLALQADLDTVDGQLERVQTQLAEMTERYKNLKAEFLLATEALERWEVEAKEWASRDEERVKVDGRVVALETEMAVMAKEMDELRATLAEREEDKVRLKERMEAALADLEAKLNAEVTHRFVLLHPGHFSHSELTHCSDLGRAKADAAEKEARQAKEELAEVTRTATDYAAMIQRKEADATRAAADVASMRRERDAALKQVAELQAHSDIISNELVAQKDDRERAVAARTKLQAELDELRVAMDAKSSEETKRSEAERSRELELADLRSQQARLAEELAEARKSGGEAQTALRTVQHERDELLTRRASLLKKAEDGDKKSKDSEAQLANAEKARRAAESELQALRMRQVDLDGQLAEAVKAKEVCYTARRPRPFRLHAVRSRIANSHPHTRSTRTLRTRYCRSSARRHRGFGRWRQLGRSWRRRLRSAHNSRSPQRKTTPKLRSSRIVTSSSSASSRRHKMTSIIASGTCRTFAQSRTRPSSNMSTSSRRPNVLPTSNLQTLKPSFVQRNRNCARCSRSRLVCSPIPKTPHAKPRKNVPSIAPRTSRFVRPRRRQTSCAPKSRRSVGLARLLKRRHAGWTATRRTSPLS
ncbi:hypothetical protein EXIGLDRAFT_301029 [Exidia glandulosa HHB12029]|uniref:P-loop containing nucleoside triphosphate hydrolase protein n=1 Tax=Exidia glandulosa HHB12029 TaxID=1314781 RepID=A0A165D7Z6_EXIGL|nr:hypothetical protein EXIGLDRAFT_301029 [Exidia glandulosa HHB12029]